MAIYTTCRCDGIVRTLHWRWVRRKHWQCRCATQSNGAFPFFLDAHRVL